MTKQEFFNLPTNKKTVSLLKGLSRKGFMHGAPLPDGSTLQADDFAKNNWVFLNEVGSAIQSYLSLPRAVKKIVDPVTTESVYNKCEIIKSMGYRKDLILPWTPNSKSINSTDRVKGIGPK